LLHPGRDTMSMGSTIILGIMGALLGGGVAYLLRLGTNPMQWQGWIISIIGAIVLLAMGFFVPRGRRTV